MHLVKKAHPSRNGASSIQQPVIHSPTLSRAVQSGRFQFFSTTTNRRSVMRHLWALHRIPALSRGRRRGSPIYLAPRRARRHRAHLRRRGSLRSNHSPFHNWIAPTSRAHSFSWARRCTSKTLPRLARPRPLPDMSSPTTPSTTLVYPRHLRTCRRNTTPRVYSVENLAQRDQRHETSCSPPWTVSRKHALRHALARKTKVGWRPLIRMSIRTRRRERLHRSAESLRPRQLYSRPCRPGR